MAALDQAEAVAEVVAQVTAPYQTQSNLLGPSKISAYLMCPQRYYRQYVLREAAPRSAVAALGTTVHKVAQQAHLAKWTAADAPKAAALLREMWAEVHPLTAADPSDPLTADLELAATDWLPWYLGWASEQVTIATEERWELPIPGSQVRLTGTIDRLYVAQGETVLSDLKTGKRAPSKTDLATDLQLTLYSWACRELGLPLQRAELVMVRKHATVCTTRTDDYMDAVLADTVLPVAAAIEAGVFPCNPASRYGCSYCDYRGSCAVGRGCSNDDESMEG